MDNAFALNGNRRIPGRLALFLRRIVMAHEQAGIAGQGQQLLDGAIQLMCVAAREIAASRSDNRHEKSVACEYRITELIGNDCWRMDGHVYDFPGQFSDVERLAIG